MQNRAARSLALLYRAAAFFSRAKAPVAIDSSHTAAMVVNCQNRSGNRPTPIVKNEKCLDELVRYFGFRVQPGSEGGARTNPIWQRTAKGCSVTGCLLKGDEPKEVWLAEKSGRIYGLESSKIDLNDPTRRWWGGGGRGPPLEVMRSSFSIQRAGHWIEFLSSNRSFATQCPHFVAG